MATPARIDRLRREYTAAGLDRADLAATWTEQLDRWLADAIGAELAEPNAMVLATAGADGRPSARTVLLKGYDDDGLTFFTNYASRKGRELSANPQAALVLPWVPLQRQVVAAGPVDRVSAAESAAYFRSRPRGAQLSAWASRQSEPLTSRRQLEERRRGFAARFGEDVPIPEFWGGFRLRPDTVEFWQGRPDRLHDRLQFTRRAAAWSVERLSP